MKKLNSAILNINYNIKIITNLNIVIAFILVVLTPFIFSLKLLNQNEIAQVFEYYLSILGILCFTYLTSLEDKNDIKEVVYPRKVSYTLEVVIRIVFMMLLVFAMLSFAAYIGYIQGSSFDYNIIVYGTWISCVFLGMIGFTAANITGSITSAYLVSFFYYCMEFFTRGKYTKNLYLFSLTKGSFQQGKILLLGIAAILLIVNLVIINKKS